MSTEFRLEGGSSASNRVLVIGLDGATFRALNPLCEAGFMPNLQRLVANGAYGPLQSTIPPISAAAWTTFITGKNPGKHGILHFVSLDWQQEGEITGQGVEISPGTFAVVNANSIKDATLWQMVSEAGKRVAVINVPMTYPPRPLNGLMITCMLTPPGAEHFTYPPELKDELEDYEIELDLKEKNFESSSVHVIYRLNEIMDKRARTALRLMQKEPWDLFMVVFTETDRVQHRFWQYLCPATAGYDRPNGEKYRLALHSFYANLDTWIGKLIDEAGAGVDVVVMSDHGFTAMARRRIYTQALAGELGLFSLRKASWSNRLRLLVEGVFGLRYKQIYYMLSKVVPKRLLVRTLQDLRTRDRAGYSSQRGRIITIQQGIGGLMLNQAQLGPDLAPVLAELRGRLEQLRDPVDGCKLVTRVTVPDEIYSGPFTRKFPPLIFFLEEGYGLSRGTGRYGRMVEHQPTAPDGQGTHDPVGILILQGPNICPQKLTNELYIPDVTATILYLLGLAIPDDLDGRVLEEAFDVDFVRARPVRQGQGRKVQEVPEEKSPWYSRDEEEAVKARLRGLGYID